MVALLRGGRRPAPLRSHLEGAKLLAADGKRASPPGTRDNHPTLQRLASAKDFKRWTKTVAKKGDRGPFFAQIVTLLTQFEQLERASGPAASKTSVLQQLLDHVAGGSVLNKAHPRVTSLVIDVQALLPADATATISTPQGGAGTGPPVGTTPVTAANTGGLPTGQPPSATGTAAASGPTTGGLVPVVPTLTPPALDAGQRALDALRAARPPRVNDATENRMSNCAMATLAAVTGGSTAGDVTLRWQTLHGGRTGTGLKREQQDTNTWAMMMLPSDVTQSMAKGFLDSLAGFEEGAYQLGDSQLYGMIAYLTRLAAEEGGAAGATHDFQVFVHGDPGDDMWPEATVLAAMRTYPSGTRFATFVYKDDPNQADPSLKQHTTQHWVYAENYGGSVQFGDFQVRDSNDPLTAILNAFPLSPDPGDAAAGKGFDQGCFIAMAPVPKGAITPLTVTGTALAPGALEAKLNALRDRLSILRESRKVNIGAGGAAPTIPLGTSNEDELKILYGARDSLRGSTYSATATRITTLEKLVATNRGISREDVRDQVAIRTKAVFQVTLPTAIPATERMYVHGSTPELSSFTEADAIRMRNTGLTTWEVGVDLFNQRGKTLHYQFFQKGKLGMALSLTKDSGAIHSCVVPDALTATFAQPFVSSNVFTAPNMMEQGQAQVDYDAISADHTIYQATKAGLPDDARRVQIESLNTRITAWLNNPGNRLASRMNAAGTNGPKHQLAADLRQWRANLDREAIPLGVPFLGDQFYVLAGAEFFTIQAKTMAKTRAFVTEHDMPVRMLRETRGNMDYLALDRSGVVLGVISPEDPHVLPVQETALTATAPLFGAEGPTLEDIVQGEIGDCYLMAAISSIVARSPGYVQTQLLVDNGATVTVNFFDAPGSASPITVPKSVATRPGALGGGAKFSRGALWVQMLEKAYAAKGYGVHPTKSIASYSELNAGNGAEAMMHLLGQTATEEAISADTSSYASSTAAATYSGDQLALYTKIETAVNSNQAVTLGTRVVSEIGAEADPAEVGAAGGAGEARIRGVYAQHAHAVLAVGPQPGSLVPLRGVTIRDPYNNYAMVYDADASGQITRRAKGQAPGLPSGTSWVELRDIKRLFDALIISSMSLPAAPSVHIAVAEETAYTTSPARVPISVGPTAPARVVVQVDRGTWVTANFSAGAWGVDLDLAALGPGLHSLLALAESTAGVKGTSTVRTIKYQP